MESLTKTWLRDNVEQVVDAEAEAREAAEKGRSGPKFGPWAHADYQRADTNDLLRQLIRAVYEANNWQVRGKHEPTPRPRPRIRYDNSTSANALKAEAAAHHARRVAAGLETR